MKTRTRNLKRLLSWLLCLSMVAGLLPVTALAVTQDGTMSATIYTGQDSYGAFTGETTTFAVDQSGLILDLRDFDAALPDGAEVESIAFYPESASAEDWGTVFWFNGDAEHPCDNGEPNDKLYVDGTYNGVFQILNFTPDGNLPLEPGTYKVLAYVGNGQIGDAYQELYYLSKETFTITEGGSGGSDDYIIDMTVTKGGVSVTEFANTDTITISATPPKDPSGVESVIFVGSDYKSYLIYLESDSIQVSGSQVTITLEGGLYERVNDSQTGESSKGNALPADDYFIRIWDYDNNDPYTSSRSFTVTDGTVTAGGPAITTTSLPDATRGTPYSTELKATAGSGGSLAWEVTQGTLPDGLTLSSGGVISGTPTAAGSSTFTVQVTETTGGGEALPATKQFTLTVQAPAGPTIITESLPGGVTGTAYSQTLRATPGTEGNAVTWSVTYGSLPVGLMLGTDGSITGTPTTAGSYTFTVTAAEQDGGEASKSFTIVITQAITSTGLTVTGGSYSPGDKISVYWNMSASLPGDAAATLTLYYTDTSGEEQTATYGMTRYSNYFYAYVKLPGDCASVEKLSASATVGGQTVTGENTQPGITMKGKLSLTWTSLANSGR